VLFDRDLGVDYVDYWTAKVQMREIGNKGDSSEGHVVRVVHPHHRDEQGAAAWCPLHGDATVR
jgi:hypothetical protein